MAFISISQEKATSCVRLDDILVSLVVAGVE